MSSTNGAVGAEEVVVDAFYGTLYALDGSAGGSGNVWKFPNGQDTWQALGTTQCNSSPTELQTFVQIVVKNTVVYGLSTTGTVWFYTGTNGCWTQAGSKTAWATSLATDNGQTVGVWAVDTSGNIWTAN
jgi:hypothetical protein